MSAVIIGLCGGMGVGKSTAFESVQFLYGKNAVLVKFAQPLYDMQEFIYRRISSVYQRPEGFKKDRKLLQLLGTEWGRDMISPSIWIDLWKNELVRIRESGKIAVCDDVRFPNEILALKELCGYLVMVKSDKVLARVGDQLGIGGHTSEKPLDENAMDAIITNNGTKKEFHEKILNLLKDLSSITRQKQSADSAKE